MANILGLSLGRTVNTALFELGKRKSGIYLTMGLVGIGSAFVMGCNKSRKLDDVIDNAKKEVDDIKETYNDERNKDGILYSEESCKKDIKKVQGQMILDLTKMYAVPVGILITSTGLIILSHKVIKDKNAELAAAYFALDQSYKSYRKRMAEKYGTEAERDIRFDIHDEEEEVVDEKGKTKKETVSKVTSDPYDVSRFFDSASRYWKDDPELDLAFLKAQEQFANDKLERMGYVYLNDVYEALDIPKTKAGHVLGWKYDPNVIHKISFGIYDIHDSSKRRFVNGYEPVILLDFNIDGNIYNETKESDWPKR